MPALHILVLALIQGITEFLPISSSGHLILVREFLGNEETSNWSQDLLMDVAVHVGTLLSVMVYFRNDLKQMILALINTNQPGNKKKHDQNLILYILISSIPVVLGGLLLYVWVPEWIRTTHTVAWTTIIFGIILWIADKKAPTQKNVQDIHLKDAVWIGLAQTLALIPGTSRSGITMTMARILGFNRVAAARYSLLLAIIAISGAGTLGIRDVIQSGDLALTGHMIMAVILSFLSGWAAISLMMNWLKKASFTIFAVYRIALGSVLLVLIYSGTL